jgi:hydroxyethylthiazole kinase-like uncharacterized protein yjeF
MPIPLLRAAELRAIEVEHAGATPTLMERAGRAAAEFVQAHFGHGRVLVCAGPGNNGGDGFVLARELARAGRHVCVHFVGDAARLPPDAAAAYQSCRATRADFCPEIPAENYSLVVDALFGIGLARPITGDLAALIERINAFAGPVLALDIPSGLDGDSGRVLGSAVRATHTLSFIGGKPGLYTLDGPDHCGDIHVDELGLPLAGHPGALLSTVDFRAGLTTTPTQLPQGQPWLARRDRRRARHERSRTAGSTGRTATRCRACLRRPAGNAGGRSGTARVDAAFAQRSTGRGHGHRRRSRHG